ncbi:MAG: ABC transporter permease, partial [Bacteroidota bacterium]
MGGLIAFPCLVVISAFLIHLGGIMAGETADVLNAQEFANGVRMYYDEFQVTFMMIKSVVFGFIVTTVSCYHGYFVKGGPREVGQASTRAVVTSAIAVFIADYILAALLL